MTPERWQQIKQLYHAALTHDQNQRAAFLRDACAGDDALRQEIESLLVHGAEAKSFLEVPALEAATKLFAELQGQSFIGRQMGSCQIVSLLGTGGMGEVYEARDTKLGRKVAIKVLPSAFGQDPERLARFQREARMLAALNHPNIATIYGLEQSDGVHYLLMELVPGQTLAERISQGAWPLPEALKVAGQIAEALEAAHEKGVIHRDLKPTNVKVTPEGRVKVLDFGLAKAFAGDGEQDLSQALTLTAMGTEEGKILGTPAYMSPEQARGKAVDKRTDIWAFGCVLYELLTTKQAFRGETLTDILAAVLEREPDWQALPTSTPARVRDLLRRCLQKDSQRRLRDFGDARIEIEEALAPPLALPAVESLKHDSDSGRAAVAVAEARLKPAKKPARFRWAVATGATMLVIGLAVWGWLFFPRKAHALTDKDTIVLADFTNTTGDAVFDGTLGQGLSVQLEQSPFLSIISDQKIQQTLEMMGQKPDVQLTSQIAREICQRTASAAVLEGSIAQLGTQYNLILKAVNCVSGESLASTEAQANDKNHVLDALGKTASEIRNKLGESRSTVRKFDTPLDQATTPSLEALKALSSGNRVLRITGDAAAIPFFKRAIELDPNFALAYAMLGIAYNDIGEPSIAADYTRKAYALRKRTSEPEKYFIAARFHKEVTGNIETAVQFCELWIQAYPRTEMPHDLLTGAIYPVIGQYEKAVEEGREAVRLNSDSPIAYALLNFNYIHLNRLDEAKATYGQALARKLNYPFFYIGLYEIAFLQNDAAGMTQQVARSAGQPGAEDELLGLEADTAAYSGRLRNAREFSRRAMDSAERAQEKEAAATYSVLSGLREALFGNADEAQRRAALAMGRSTGRDVQYGVALALAFADGDGRSQMLMGDLRKRFPEDTIVQFNYLPTLRAKHAVSRRNPSEAIESLRAATPYELGQTTFSTPGWTALYPVFVRGEAYLAAHQGSEAAAEFQKILDHSGIVLNQPIGALAHLGLARAYMLQGNTVKARAAYQDFLTLWKDADPDIPILKQAKAEYAKLQ